MRTTRTPTSAGKATLRGVAALAVLAFSLPASATSVAPITNPPASPTISISSDRPAYTLGEAIVLSVRVANDTSAPIAVHRFSDTSTGMVWPQVARGSGEFLRYIGPDFGVKHSLIRETPLAPGEDFVVPVRVLFHVTTGDAGDLPYFYAFEQAGSYRVRVEVIDLVPSQRLISNTIVVEMRQPVGVDATVWAMLQKNDAARLLHTGSASGASLEVRTFEQLLTRYPDAIYAGAIQSSLGVQAELAARNPRAIVAGTTEIVELPGRTFVASAPSSLTGTPVQAASRALAELVSGWTAAWNSRDTARLVHYLSTGNGLRQKWDQGPSDADRETVVKQFEDAFAAIGTLSIDVVSTEMSEQSASADLVVRTSEGAPRIAARTMKFVRDAGAWRISEVGF